MGRPPRLLVKPADLWSVVGGLSSVWMLMFFLETVLSIHKDGGSLLSEGSLPPTAPCPSLEFTCHSRKRLLKTAMQSVLVTHVNSPIFQSDVISTFDMPVFL